MADAEILIENMTEKPHRFLAAVAFKLAVIIPGTKPVFIRRHSSQLMKSQPTVCKMPHKRIRPGISQKSSYLPKKNTAIVQLACCC